MHDVRVLRDALIVLIVAFSPDGKRLASGSGDGTVKVWDAATGQENPTLIKGNSSYPTWVAFSPDGKRLASVGNNDGIVKVCDAATGHLTQSRRAPAHPPVERTGNVDRHEGLPFIV